MDERERKSEAPSQLSVWVPVWLHRWLKSRSAEKGLSLKTFIAKLLLDAHRRDKEPPT